MGWFLRRKLSQNASRLAALRAELKVLDEQVEAIRSEADDLEIRALVSETPGAGREASDGRKHATALEKHRQHVRDEIARLGQRQDELLDEMTRNTQAGRTS